MWIFLGIIFWLASLLVVSRWSGHRGYKIKEEELEDNERIKKEQLEGITKKKLKEEEKEEKPKRIMHHVCLSIRGALRGLMFDDFIHDDGSSMSRDEAFEFLCDQLEMGRRVLPMAECEDFDYQTGCPGHDIEEDNNV